MPRSHVFSRAWRRYMRLFRILIGSLCCSRLYYFGFGFTTLNSKTVLNITKQFTHLPLLLKRFIAEVKGIGGQRKLDSLFSQKKLLLASFQKLLLLLLLLLLLKWLHHLVKLLQLRLVYRSRHAPHAVISGIHHRIHKGILCGNWDKSTTYCQGLRLY